MAKGSRKSIIHYREVTYNDEIYQLAVIGKGRNVPIPEKVKIAKLVCTMYATNNYSLDECLAFCGIKSDSTWYDWLDSIEEIEPLYIDAQRQNSKKYYHKLKERARTMAEKMMEGYTVDVKETEEQIDEDGEMKVTKVRNKKIVMRPSVQLIQNVLYNTDARNFEKNPKPVEKINKDVDIPPIKWVE